MLNELSTCSQLFFLIPSLLFDCLEFREVSQKEQTQKIKVNLSSSLKVPKNLLKSRDFQEECILSAIQILSAHFAQWSYHVSFPEVATIPLMLLKRLHEQTALESLHRPIKRMIDQVNENKDFIQRKREDVSFSPNDKASIESFLQTIALHAGLTVAPEVAEKLFLECMRRRAKETLHSHDFMHPLQKTINREGEECFKMSDGMTGNHLDLVGLHTWIERMHLGHLGLAEGKNHLM